MLMVEIQSTGWMNVNNEKFFLWATDHSDPSHQSQVYKDSLLYWAVEELLMTKQIYTAPHTQRKTDMGACLILPAWHLYRPITLK